MFNLLVKAKAWGDGHDRIPAKRLWDYTESSFLQQLIVGKDFPLQSLAELPTLFVQETPTQANLFARIGRVNRIKQVERDLVIDYAFDPGAPRIPNELLLRISSELDIREVEFERTHWAVKDVDLYRVLLKNLHICRQRPKIFNLSEIEVVDQSLVSAMMPFNSGFSAVYRIIQQTAQEAGLVCRRADDIWENASVMQDVISLIDRSGIVICDCTGRNANVFYEIGIAHTLGREVILITQSESDIPFDLRHLRYVPYLNNFEGLSDLASKLMPRLVDQGKLGRTVIPPKRR
jgi:hypothetical protein